MAHYFLLPLLSVTIWAMNAVVNKLAAGVIPPGVIAFDRWLLAFVALTPFVIRDAWARREIIPTELPKVALLGWVGLAICQGVGYYAARYTTATNMALLLSLVPLVTLLMLAVFQKQAPGRNVLSGAVVSLVGILLVLGQGNPLNLLSSGAGRGDALMLIVVLAYGIYNILLKAWSGILPVFTSLYVQIGCALVFLLPTYLIAPAASYDLSNITMIVFAGIPASILAPAIWMIAIKALGPGRTTIFMNLIPIIATAVAVVFLGEPLEWFHLAGGMMTIMGVAVSQRERNR